MKPLPNFSDVEYFVREYQRTSQGHFFDKSTMQFFKSRLTSHFRKVDEIEDWEGNLISIEDFEELPEDLQDRCKIYTKGA